MTPQYAATRRRKPLPRRNPNASEAGGVARQKLAAGNDSVYLLSDGFTCGRRSALLGRSNWMDSHSVYCMEKNGTRSRNLKLQQRRRDFWV
jgi:hypothetical protein